MTEFLANGLEGHDLALLLQRLIIGAFFILARFRWIYDPSIRYVKYYPMPIGKILPDWDKTNKERWFPKGRHLSLVRKCETCGFGYRPWLAGSVALTEIFAAVGLVVGFLTIPAASAIALILVAATICTAREKVERQAPLDRIDWVASYLWLAEPLYITLALCLVLTGAGAYSLDAWVWR